MNKQRVLGLLVRAPGVALLAYVAVLGLVLLLLPLELTQRQLISNVGQIPTYLFAAWFCWLAARRSSEPRDRRAWLFLGLFCVVWAVGQSSWAYCESVLGLTRPAPLVPTVIWILQYPLAFIGLALQGVAIKQAYERVAVTLDAVLLWLSLVGLDWVLVIQPIVSLGPWSLATFLMIATPVGDLLLLLVVISLILRTPFNRVPTQYLYLCFAFAIKILGDAAFSLLQVPTDGTAFVSLWALVGALIGLAALASYDSPREEAWRGLESVVDRTWARSIRMLLPYLAIPAAGLIFLLDYQDYQRQQTLATAQASRFIAFAAVLAALVMLRQLLMILENNRQHDELVATTMRLALLNEFATKLSQCVAGTEVLQVGLDLAREAFGAASGAVWLVASTGEISLALAPDIPDADRVLLGILPKQAPLIAHAIRTGEVFRYAAPETIRTHEVAYLGGHQPTGVLIFPLVSHGIVHGAMSLVYLNGREFSATDGDFGASVGAELGVALESARRYEEARLLADLDPMTGLLNHRAFHNRLEQELKRSRRAGESLSVVMMDVDGFKRFNDTYGHPFGDQVLRHVSAQLARTARASDVIGRYGGDEFVAMLPDTTAAGALVLAERFRFDIASQNIDPRSGEPVTVQMSFGIATYPSDAKSSEELVGVADANLYASKQQGGGAITVSGKSS